MSLMRLLQTHRSSGIYDGFISGDYTSAFHLKAMAVWRYDQDFSWIFDKIIDTWLVDMISLFPNFTILKGLCWLHLILLIRFWYLKKITPFLEIEGMRGIFLKFMRAMNLIIHSFLLLYHLKFAWYHSCGSYATYTLLRW